MKKLKLPRVAVPKPTRIILDKRGSPPKHKTQWDRLDTLYKE
jgi:hypothetical protein